MIRLLSYLTTVITYEEIGTYLHLYFEQKNSVRMIITVTSLDYCSTKNIIHNYGCSR